MIDKQALLEWLARIDKKIKKQITVIAVGGTAMTLLSLKPSTKDVDFCLKGVDKTSFEKAMSKEFKVDIFIDGYIFSEQLPDDYIEKAKEILKGENITLKALHPIDIVITKAARLNARDEEDIMALKKYINKEELIRRFEEVVRTYAGREEDYKYNFEYILKRLF